MTLCKLVVCDQIFFLALVGKCSNVTWRACRCLLPAIFPASPAELRRRDSAKLPPARQRTAMRPHSYTPAGISEHLSPPCGLPFKQRKAIFFEHQHFSKADPTLGEYIIIRSRAHLVAQHLGGRFHWFSSPRRRENSHSKCNKKNRSIIMSC